MAAQVEQGGLADLIACAHGGDKAECEICFATGLIPGCCFTDEHDGEVRVVARGAERIKQNYGTTLQIRGLLDCISGFFVFVTIDCGKSAKHVNVNCKDRFLCSVR